MNITKRLYIYLATLLLAFASGEACLASQPDETFSPVLSPVIPSSIVFADSTVSLDDPMMWERFDRELTSMVYTHGNTLLSLKRANKLFPRIMPILKKEGVPEDLIYLAVIESTLNPRAVSGAKAAGLWQFMPATAREFGLEVNDYVDERFDVEKSTRAACRYLKNAYSRYGKWESVAASYNGGMGRVSSELAAQHADTAYNLYLPEETMRYIFRLLAAKTIMENPAEYGYRLSASDLYQPPVYVEYEVSGPVADWRDWAREHNTDYLTLREHNPWIRAKSLPNPDGRKYTVRIPDKASQSRSTQSPKVFDPRWIAPARKSDFNFKCY